MSRPRSASHFSSSDAVNRERGHLARSSILPLAIYLVDSPFPQRADQQLRPRGTHTGRSVCSSYAARAVPREHAAPPQPAPIVDPPPTRATRPPTPPPRANFGRRVVLDAPGPPPPTGHTVAPALTIPPLYAPFACFPPLSGRLSYRRSFMPKKKHARGGFRTPGNSSAAGFGMTPVVERRCDAGAPRFKLQA